VVHLFGKIVKRQVCQKGDELPTAGLLKSHDDDSMTMRLWQYQDSSMRIVLVEGRRIRRVKGRVCESC